MELFKLFGRVLVETSDADKSLDKTDGKAKTVSGNLSGYMEKIQKWAGVLKAAIVGSAIVKALQQIVNISSEVAAAADEIDKESQKLGLSAKAYQEWAYILEHNGTSINSAAQAIKTLTRNVGSETEATMQALERIGISTNFALTATPEELWETVIRHLQEMEPGTQRTAVATALFGEAANELNPLLNASSEETEALRGKINDLGGVMSDTLISKGAQYEDAVTDLKTAWSGFKYDLAENTIPGMIDVVNGLTEILTGDFVSGLETAGAGVVEFLDGCLQTILGFDKPVKDQISIWITDLETFLADLWGVSGQLASIRQQENETGEAWWETAGIGAPPSEWAHSQAVGLPFVPRDNYPANLHYGERVLTRQEAESYNRGSGSGGGFQITQNITAVAQSPAQLAAATAAAFETVRWKI